MPETPEFAIQIRLNGDMVSPKRRIFRFFQLAAQSGRGLPFREGRAETAGNGAATAKNGTGERKFQKGE